MQFAHNDFIFSDSRNDESINLDDLMMFFKIKTESDLEDVSSYYGEFFDCKMKVRNILLSFLDFPIEVGSYDERRLIPDFLWRRYRVSKEDLYRDALDYFSKMVGPENFKKICSFFLKFQSTIIDKLKYSVTTKNGKAEISLLFAENFRFKSEQDTLNIFNLHKEARDVIIPEKNAIIFSADFRQFEFRTFLHIQGLDQYLQFENIYEKIGHDLGIHDDAKSAIISYLYGSKNVKLESFFQKDSLLEKIESNVFWFNDLPVFIKEDYDPGKKIHTINQTISQYCYIDKLNQILNLMNGKNSKFIFPLHDSIIISLDRGEDFLFDNILDIMEDNVYKVKCYAGDNFRDIEEI